MLRYLEVLFTAVFCIFIIWALLSWIEILANSGAGNTHIYNSLNLIQMLVNLAGH